MKNPSLTLSLIFHSFGKKNSKTHTDRQTLHTFLRLLYRFISFSSSLHSDSTAPIMLFKSLAFWSRRRKKKTQTQWLLSSSLHVLCSRLSSPSLFSPACLLRLTLSSPTTTKFLTSPLHPSAFLSRFVSVPHFTFLPFFPRKSRIRWSDKGLTDFSLSIERFNGVS